MKQKKNGPIRHSIRFKIFLVSLVPTIALLMAALLNNQYLNSLGESAEQILSKNYKSIRAAQEARKTLEEIRNLLLEQVPRDQKTIIVPLETLRKLSSNLNICRENITEEGERELIDRLFDSYRRYQALARSLVEATGPLWPSDRFTGFLKLTAGMVTLIDDLVAVNEGAMERAEQETRLLARRAQRNAAVLFGIIITAILALSYFLSYRIAKPIMILARELSKTKEGAGSYPMIPSRTNDEIGFLTESFNRLFSRLEQYDHHRDDIIAAEREKVRRSEEAKGRFIAEISHQLKTPMTSLAMSVGMLYSRGQGLDAKKKATLVSTAHDDCTRLTALINELVDISRLETLSRPRPKETLDIGLVVRECLAPLMKQAESRGISIEIDMPDNLPKMTIDSFRFPWVLTNLVGNALRYTDRGGRIILKVFIEGSRFYFQCNDTGSGIDPEFLPHIFDRFAQFSERGKSGTIGLGLAIVKDIIEQHGGDVQVQSKVGEGTTFTFWIPAFKEENGEKNADHRR
ncbi:MAG: HAMP domain-containing histidine kinase [Deltaproteobacteria bacterium]|nr:HAMP domain-containing histidine kinase [Deltaproteobacteria bacterium]